MFKLLCLAVLAAVCYVKRVKLVEVIASAVAFVRDRAGL